MNHKFTTKTLLAILTVFLFSQVQAIHAQPLTSGISLPISLSDPQAKQGSLVCAQTGGFKLCQTEYDPSTYGVITTNPAISIEIVQSEQGEDVKQTTSSGKAVVLVTSVNGNINAGDFVASSLKKGVAMKADRNGYVLGIALENYESDDPEKIGDIFMDQTGDFKWRHYEGKIIVLCVRWYTRYPLSYRNLEEMMQERGLGVDHTTIYRWVQHYAPELNKRVRPHLRKSNDSYRIDETYIKVKGEWKYLYRAVDSSGDTLDFMLSHTRCAKAAKRFFKKTLKAEHASSPRVANVDKNAAYPMAVDELKEEEPYHDR